MDQRASTVETAVHRGLESINSSRLQANEVVSTINETQSSVQNAARGVTEISQSVREQSNASTLVAQNIEQIAKMVESSHAAIDASAEATSSLGQVARALKNSVSKFKMG